MQQLNEDFFDRIRPEDIENNPGDDVKNTDNSTNDYPFFIEMDRLLLAPGIDYAKYKNRKFFPKEKQVIEYDFDYKYKIQMFYKRLKNLCEHLVMFNDGYSLDFILKISVTETRRWVETIHFDPDENWETVFDMFDVDKYIREL